MQRPPLSRSEQLTFSVLSDGENSRQPKVQVRLESEFIAPSSFLPTGKAMHDILVSSSEVPFPVTHVHMQAANEASQVYPSLISSSSSAPAEITGPSGILVQVEYDTSAVQCAISASSSSPAMVRQYFLNTTLPQLVGARRVLTAPLGSSMSIRRLHRMVQCHAKENAVAIVQCTTVLPFEGAHAAFSVEGFRTFLALTNPAGIGSLATAAEWSHWFLGSGQALPATLAAAANEWSPSAERREDDSSRRLVGRRMYWIDWRRQMVPEGDHNHSPIVTTRYGWQYTVQLPRSSDPANVHSPRALSLNDLLPSTNQFWQPDPFADASTIQVVPSSSAIEWGSACETSSRNSKRERLRQHFTGDFTLDRTQPCFAILWTDKNLTKPEIATADHSFWSVYAHVGRPSAGQAYRGTLMGHVQNRLPRCGTSVRVQQWVPGVVEPVWQSLQIRVISLPESSSVPEEKARLISVPEANYHVEFQESASFLWQLQYSLPPQSQLEWRLDYEPSFLSIDEFPGDANRGFDIPPVQADFAVLLDGSDECQAILEQTMGGPEDAPFMVRLYSNAVLLLAPLPDRSMPFNVLSFTCTFYVFVIGSLMNLMVKKVSAQMKAALEGKKESKLQQVWKKVRTKLDRFTLRKQQQQNETGDEKKDQ